VVRQVVLGGRLTRRREKGHFSLSLGQGRRQKNFQGGNNKKDQNIAKKIKKIALLSLFRGGEATEKIPKNSTIKPISV